MPEIKVHDHKKVYECPRFQVNETVYQVGEAEARKTYKLELTGDLLIIIPRFKQKIVMLKDRYPPDEQELWSFPTGFVVAGMPVADTAQSILSEKTGCVAQKFHTLGSFEISRYIDNVAHVMAADGLTRLGEQSAEFKDKVGMFTEQEIGSLLINRELYDGLALASYVFYATSNYFVEVHNGPNKPNNPNNPNNT